MILNEILQPGYVKVPLVATDKRGVINELADVLCAAADISEVQQHKDAIWAREQTRTTGIGHGIGIPHGKCVGIEKLIMAVGRTAQPIDFGAIDGKPVQMIFLLASPIDQTGPHIQALAMISRMLTDTQLRADIRQCDDARTLYDLLIRHDARQTV